MRTMYRLLPGLTLLLATSAFADPLTPDMPAEIDAHLWRSPTIIDEYFFDGVQARDDHFLYFEGATINDVQAKLGGTIQENFEHRWLCYEASGLRIHFAGPYRQFGEPSPFEMVSIERVDEGNRDCLAKPELATIAVRANGDTDHGDLPGIGASMNDLLARFDSASILDGGRVSYRSVDVGGDDPSWSIIKTAYYRVTNGVVDQVAISRETPENPLFTGWAEGHYAETAPDAVYTELSEPLFGAFDIGGKPVTLEADLLPDVLARFGGEISQQGEAGAHVVWGCFIKDGTRVWLTSDGEMGGPENKLMGVALDPSDVFDYSATCVDAPEGFTVPEFEGLPLLGATEAELKAHFGSAVVDSFGHVHYTAIVPRNDGTPMAAYQSIDYRIEGGKVTGVAIGQETGD